MESQPQTGHIGWSIYNSNGRRVEVLEDGVICANIMRIIDRGHPFETAKVSGWISKCVDILRSHDSEFVADRYAGVDGRITIDGSYYYTSTSSPYDLNSNPVAYNHSTNAAEAMLYICKTGSYPDFEVKHNLVADFFTRYLVNNGEGYVWFYGIDKDGNPLTGVNEDVNHSTYDASFILQHPNVSTTVKDRFNKTVPNFLTSTTCAHFVDGSGDGDEGDRISMYSGYLDYSLQNDEAVRDLIVTNLTNLINRNNTQFWHSYMAASSKLGVIYGY